ncbi:hypothetical protein PVAP13_6NG004731 [Panicum virgatum]|uniref:Uncharacterized protein n=1 Tax=Panicum virgatum TaxID=38727 RepID=A0A8T0QSA5_PANVG|nr:hypothetical protein PVAP13_6NG004731 [Panicum virgatum]
MSPSAENTDAAPIPSGKKANKKKLPHVDVSEMLLFNEAISALGVVELPLQGKQFTWSNKEQPPLLERLHWFFTFAEWTSCFPDTSVKTLSMETSDHTHCLITAGSNIPKGGGIFRFENYLMEHEHFLSIVQHAWSLPNLRRVIKAWQSHLSSLDVNIANVKLIIIFLSLLEEFRDLTLEEWNCRKLLEDKLLLLLKQQRIY